MPDMRESRRKVIAQASGMTASTTPFHYHSERLARLGTGFDLPSPIRVLVVEDSRTVRHQLRGYLQLLENITVVEAGTLAQTQELLEAESGQLFCAILDLTLPDASGSEVVDLVQTYKVPSIVLTATPDPAIRQAMMERRVIDYMYKTGTHAIEDVAYLVGRLRQNQDMPVLVVDDSATFRIHLSHLLAQYRFPIFTANNGVEALDLLEAHPEIALVITDYHMPLMDGLALVRAIRRSYRREDLAIVALSEANRPEFVAAMIKAGANDYLDKHFLLEEFYCRIVQNINMVRFVRQLHDMANRDYLTRLYNRRKLFEVGEPLLDNARRNQTPAFVALLDADHFKLINDHYGHELGDQALRRIADVLLANSRPNRFFSRYGGEEFICVSLLAPDESPGDILEALRQQIEAITLEAESTRIRITISIGYTINCEGNLRETISRADQATYQAKAQGRNRVICHSAEH